MKQKSLRRKIYETAAEILVGGVPAKDAHVPIEERMNQQWYGSGQTDFSFYSHPDYRYLLLNSWVVASQFDVEKVVRMGLLRDPAVILDFHGGVGMSAAYLAASYPHVDVFSHSAVDWHREAVEDLAHRLGLNNLHPTNDIVSADFVLAQETLEHFRDPFFELRMLMVRTRFQQYLDGSSFTFDSPGHFNPFYDGETLVPRDRAKRRLNSILRDSGYVRPWEDPKLGIEKLFNGRPALWSLPLA